MVKFNITKEFLREYKTIRADNTPACVAFTWAGERVIPNFRLKQEYRIQRKQNPTTPAWMLCRWAKDRLPNWDGGKAAARFEREAMNEARYYPRWW